MRNIIKNVFLFVSLLPFIAVGAQEYIKQDTVYRKDGTLWRINEYIDGQMIKRTTYDKWGRKYDVTPFRMENLSDGRSFGILITILTSDVFVKVGDRLVS